MNIRNIFLSILLFFAGGFLLLMVTLVFLAGGGEPFLWKTNQSALPPVASSPDPPNPSAKNPPESPDVPEISDPFRKPKPGDTEEKCGFTSCNGYEQLDCSDQVPTMCPEVYKLGDGCRQYAECVTTNGSCELQTDSTFDSCVSCVEDCKQQFEGTGDPSGLFSCEQQCREALQP